MSLRGGGKAPAHAAAGQVVTLTRTLTPPESERLERILAAARDLAGQGGYAEVNMQEVAERAGVSRATLYRYVSSKDQLLAMAGTAWVERIANELREETPGGIAPRVEELLERMLQLAEEEPRLTAALLQASAKAESGRWMSRLPIRAAIRQTLKERGDESAPAAVDPLDAEVVITHVLYSALVSLTQRGRDPASVRDVIRATLRVVFRS